MYDNKKYTFTRSLLNEEHKDVRLPWLVPFASAGMSEFAGQTETYYSELVVLP